MTLNHVRGQNGRRPGDEAIGMHVIFSESKEAAASSASMLGTPMVCTLHTDPSHHALSKERWLYCYMDSWKLSNQFLTRKKKNLWITKGMVVSAIRPQWPTTIQDMKLWVRCQKRFSGVILQPLENAIIPSKCRNWGWRFWLHCRDHSLRCAIPLFTDTTTWPWLQKYSIRTFQYSYHCLPRQCTHAIYWHKVIALRPGASFWSEDAEPVTQNYQKCCCHF